MRGDPDFIHELKRHKDSNPLPLPAAHPVTVLFIDDQAMIVEAVRRILSNEKDIVFFSCTDPKEAIDIANECCPTVILQDLIMPDIDGITLVKQFRQNPLTQNIPMIVLSSEEDPVIKAEAFRVGANDYIVKLPNPLELIARIRYHSNSYIHLLQRNEAYERLATLQKDQKQILDNIFPQAVTEELLTHGFVSSRLYEAVTIMFIDFVGFTVSTQNVSPNILVEALDSYFEHFDAIMDKHGVERIKTIGDGYMAVSGVPENSNSKVTNAMNAIHAAIDVIRFVKECAGKMQEKYQLSWDARIGIHTGRVVAGVIGKRRPAYDIWGDSVNLASRMESHSKPNKINISEATYELISQCPDKYFRIRHRGAIPVKNKEGIEMYCNMLYIEEDSIS